MTEAVLLSSKEKLHPWPLPLKERDFMKPISEGWARTIDCLAKLITAIAIDFGGLWAVYQFFDGRAYQLVTARIGAEKIFLEKRLELYAETTSAVSTIVTSKNESEVTKAKEQFWKLSEGPMLLVSDAKVEQSMLEFGHCLKDKTKCVPDIEELAHRLALDCSHSFRAYWPPPGVVTDLRVKVQ
jgi:hypothetical protein